MTRPSIGHLGTPGIAPPARARRLPLGQDWSLPMAVSLPLAIAVSLALWCGLGFAAKALFF